MSEELTDRQVKLRVLGLEKHNNRVLARVFAQKITALLKALETSDRYTNGGKRHDYTISELKASSALAVLSEYRASHRSTHDSSVPLLSLCAHAVEDDAINFGLRYLAIVKDLSGIAKGANDNFFEIELSIGRSKTVVLDRNFIIKAERIIKAQDEIKPTWFQGEVLGTFDGYVLESDFRTSTPGIILRLSAGGKEIPCTCPSLSLEDIKSLLKIRVNLTGWAYYDGESGLPKSIKVAGLPEPVPTSGDFTTWKSKPDMFTYSPWNDDE